MFTLIFLFKLIAEKIKSKNKPEVKVMSKFQKDVAANKNNFWLYVTTLVYIDDVYHRQVCTAEELIDHVFNSLTRFNKYQREYPLAQEMLEYIEKEFYAA